MDLRELKNVKLMKNEDIILPDNSKDKKVKLCLSPIYAIYLYDKDLNIFKSKGFSVFILFISFK